MKTFSTRSIYKEATVLMREHRWSKIWQYLLITAGFGIGLYALFGRGAMIASFIVAYVTTVWALSFVTKGSFSYEDIFKEVTAKDAAYFVCALLLVVLSVVGGLILLIVPGIIIGVRLVFTRYIAIEKKLSPVESLRESGRLTRGNRWKIFWFLIVSILINLLGLICLVVGLLYTIPLTQLARATLYKKLSHDTE